MRGRGVEDEVVAAAAGEAVGEEGGEAVVEEFVDDEGVEGGGDVDVGLFDGDVDAVGSEGGVAYGAETV